MGVPQPLYQSVKLKSLPTTLFNNTEHFTIMKAVCRHFLSKGIFYKEGKTKLKLKHLRKSYT